MYLLVATVLLPAADEVSLDVQVMTSVVTLASCFSTTLWLVAIIKTIRLRYCQVITNKRILVARVTFTGEWIVTSHQYWMKFSYRFISFSHTDSAFGEACEGSKGVVVVEDNNSNSLLLNKLLIYVDDFEEVRQALGRVGYEETRDELDTPGERVPSSTVKYTIIVVIIFFSVIPGFASMFALEAFEWQYLLVLGICVAWSGPMTISMLAFFHVQQY